MEPGILVIQPLSMHNIDNYLNAFSAIVRTAIDATLDAERLYLISRLQHQSSSHFYTIHYSNAIVGAIEIRAPEHAGQLYCWLNENYWGIGIFKLALQQAALTYFEQTNASFFTAHVDLENKRSYWALKKCGFADIGWHEGPRGVQYKLILRNKNKDE